VDDMGKIFLCRIESYLTSCSKFYMVVYLLRSAEARRASRPQKVRCSRINLYQRKVLGATQK